MKNLKIISALLIILSFVACKTDRYPDLKEGIYAEITTDKGVVVALLEYEKVPNTVANFISLAEGKNTFVDAKFKNKKFFDGMRFNRNDYVIQTGDPKGEGSGTGYVFPDEFPYDKEANFLLTHNVPGTLSMANSGPNTNSSQFFISLNKAPSLDGKHTVFGHVVIGKDIVDKIQTDDKVVKIEIIRKGKSATKFNAVSVFTAHFNEFSKKKREEEDKARKRNEKAEKAKKQMHRYFVNNKRLAKELPSGLRILTTKEGTGIKPKYNSQILIDFAGFRADGSLFSTTILKTAEAFNMYDERFDHDNKYKPLMQIYSKKAGLIEGLKEGMLMMEYGQRAMLFVPSELAYGDKGDGYMIGPNTNLIIEIEIIDKIID